jgi:hypothetical protein
MSQQDGPCDALGCSGLGAFVVGLDYDARTFMLCEDRTVHAVCGKLKATVPQAAIFRKWLAKALLTIVPGQCQCKFPALPS